MKKRQFVKIKRITTSKKSVMMADITVEGNHNFILENGICVCNSANIEINTLRQADYLLLKPSSLLQLDFERKKIKDIYKEVSKDFKEFSEKGTTYIYSDAYRGFVNTALPGFWTEELSKSFSKQI